MKFVLPFLFLLIVLTPSSFAKVEVAFIELRFPDGRLLQFEPEGRFAHIAISYKGKWLHSYPRKGVEITTYEDLKKIGNVKAIIVVDDMDALDESLVEKYLGKPHNLSYTWNEDKIYCSQLVAYLLGIPPTPMTFSGSSWSKAYHERKGMVGISPDDIFNALKARGYTEREVGCGLSIL